MLEKVFSDERKKEYLNAEGADKPLKSPIPHATLVRARGYRKQRMVDGVNRLDCAAILLYDPINIRYAFDVSNMQLWATHNMFHYALVFADGYGIDFEYKGAEHVTKGLETDQRGADRHELVLHVRRPASAGTGGTMGRRDRRRGASTAAAATCGLPSTAASRWASLPCRSAGWRSSRASRSPRSPAPSRAPDELELMKWTVRVCEAGMARMYEHSLPGKTEQEIWAELHYENIRSGGEWLETRLLAIGQHSNPWFQEASGFVGKTGDIIAFDTDMIGPYGYCADLSRTWTIGHTRMTNKQRELYSAALEQVNHNLALLKAGLSFAAFNERSWRIPDKYVANRYSVRAARCGHGGRMAVGAAASRFRQGL